MMKSAWLVIAVALAQDTNEALPAVDNTNEPKTDEKIVDPVVQDKPETEEKKVDPKIEPKTEEKKNDVKKPETEKKTVETKIEKKKVNPNQFTGLPD